MIATASAAGTQRTAALGTLLLGFVVVLSVTLVYIGNINFVVLSNPPLTSAGGEHHTGSGGMQSPILARRAPYPRYPGRDLLTSICGPIESVASSDRNDRDDDDGASFSSLWAGGWNAAATAGESGSAEWQRVQRLIYESQHPAECSEDGTMQWVGAFEGFTAIGIGGQLSTLSLALGLAIVRNKVLVVADNSSQLTTCPRR